MSPEMIRQALRKAKGSGKRSRPWMKLAGAICGSKGLSQRTGYSRK